MKSILLLSSSMTRRDWVRAEIILQETKMQAYILAYDQYVCRYVYEFCDKATPLDDYLSRSEWKNINELAAEWGMKWFLQPGLEGKMTWSDIELASVIEYPWHYTLNAILRLGCMVTRLIDDEKPDRLEFFLRDWEPMSVLVNDNDPLLELVAKQIAEQRGVEIVNHSGNAFFLNVFCRRYAMAKNEMLSLLREIRKLSSRLFGPKATVSHSRGTQSTQRALFVKSARSIIEVARAFQEGEGRESLCVTFGQQQASTAIRYRNMETYTPLKLSAIYRRASRLLADQSAYIHFSLADNRYFTHYGVDFFPVIKLWIKYFLHTEFPRLALNIEAAENIMRDYQADVILADNALLEVVRMFLLLARKHNIISIELQHGLLIDLIVLGSPEYYITDLNIFWGKLDRNKQIARGGDSSRFALAGNARFDSYFANLDKAMVGHARKQSTRIGVTCDKMYKFYGLVGLHNTMESIYDRYYRYVLEAARKMPEVSFSFKMKFRCETNTLLKDLIAEYQIENYEIVETVELEEWFSSLSALITDYSTMGLEAMIFDVPVIILNLTGWADPVGFELSDAVDVVHNTEELHQALSANMQSPNWRAKERAEFVRYALADTEGTAAKRTAQIISQLLHERKTTQNQHDQHV